jgi:hypothetical protein
MLAAPTTPSNAAAYIDGLLGMNARNRGWSADRQAGSMTSVQSSIARSAPMPSRVIVCSRLCFKSPAPGALPMEGGSASRRRDNSASARTTVSLSGVYSCINVAGVLVGSSFGNKVEGAWALESLSAGRISPVLRVFSVSFSKGFFLSSSAGTRAFTRSCVSAAAVAVVGWASDGAFPV